MESAFLLNVSFPIKPCQNKMTLNLILDTFNNVFFLIELLFNVIVKLDPHPILGASMKWTTTFYSFIDNFILGEPLICCTLKGQTKNRTLK